MNAVSLALVFWLNPGTCSCLLSARKCDHVGSHLQFYSAELEAQSEICHILGEGVCVERSEGGGEGIEPLIMKTLKNAPVKAQLLSFDCTTPSPS